MWIRRTVRTLVALMMLVSASILLDAGGRASAVVPGRDGRIAFTRADQIYTIHGDGTGLRQLTDAASGKNSWPRWGVYGSRIAYINEPSPGMRDLWIMNADGSAKVQVTTTGDVDGGPAWSPDGRSIAFVRQGSLHRIRTTAPFGAPTPIWGASSEIKFGDVAYGFGAPSWSATGGWIAMFVYGPCECYTMQLFNPKTKVRRFVDGVSSGDCGTVSSPAFSADGKLLRYRATICNDPTEGAIKTIRVQDGRTIEGFTSEPDDDQIAFAPSGTRIASVNDASGVPVIHVAKFDGSRRRELTQGYQPDWQRLP